MSKFIGKSSKNGLFYKSKYSFLKRIHGQKDGSVIILNYINSPSIMVKFFENPIFTGDLWVNHTLLRFITFYIKNA